MSDNLKRFVVLIAAILTLIFLGSSHAWSIFAKELTKGEVFKQADVQSTWSIYVFTFCVGLVLFGRLQDRSGPRPMAVISAVLFAVAYALGARIGDDATLLKLSMGLILGASVAAGYVCPIATAIKWFPNHRGLISGLAAGGFAGGAVVMSFVAPYFLSLHWTLQDIWNGIAIVYSAGILLTGVLLVTPPAAEAKKAFADFRRAVLWGDKRFWLLWVGMLCGTFPYLLVMPASKQIGEAFGVKLAALAITGIAVGNAVGRILCGYLLDRVGQRIAVVGTQAISVVAMVLLLTLGRNAECFMAAIMGVGFCLGSCFAIYPAIVAKTYGPHVLGSVYPLIVLAMAVSAVGATINGVLYDAFKDYMPGLYMATGVAVAGLLATIILSRPGATPPARPQATQVPEVAARS